MLCNVWLSGCRPNGRSVCYSSKDISARVFYGKNFPFCALMNKWKHSNRKFGTHSDMQLQLWTLGDGDVLPLYAIIEALRIQTHIHMSNLFEMSFIFGKFTSEMNVPAWCFFRLFLTPALFWRKFLFRR